MNNAITTAARGSLIALPLCAATLAAFGSERVPRRKVFPPAPRNVIFILSDDHRFDYMGFMGTVPWLQTPNMDYLARGGAHVSNAFVTTSLSSPSRASILTGMYSHEHTIVDNYAPMPEGLTFFPEYLREAGYRTGFFGKWHMGAVGADPQPGFDHWESFEDQGTYYNVQMNVNGEMVTYDPDEYVTDILTRDAISFIDRNRDRPFFVYLSHKAVHDPFAASPSRVGMYDGEEFVAPPTIDIPGYNLHPLPSGDSITPPATGEEWYGRGMQPDWVKNQRESWHGVGYAYYNRRDLATEQRHYCEAITSLDDSIGQLLAYLRESGLEQSTLIIYMGDNGFCWGEHGLIDKRTFYEASVRVPMLVYCPEIIRGGTVVEQMVQNVDIAPTVLDAARLPKAPQMRGESLLPLVRGEKPEGWRDRIFYEYYWEYDFPQTPTTFGVRTDRYKYIRYHGVWDINEFYDLKADPHETVNLIESPEQQELIRSMADDLYDWLEETGGMNIPLKRMVKHRWHDHRSPESY